MSKLTNFITLFIFILIGCQHNNVTPLDENSDETLTLNFSPPPISNISNDVKFAKNIPYDNKERTVFDIFLPNSNTPTSLLIYIHGGGFTSGSKEYVYNNNFSPRIRELLENNIAFATINYTLLEAQGETEGVLKSLNDAKRALQFIRFYSKTFNINKENILLAGNSAGAGTSLWIATKNDMADTTNSDSILKESTRVKAVALEQTQATYNIDKWITDVFIDYNLDENTISSTPDFSASITRLYGLSSPAELSSSETEKYKLEVDMLEALSTDDPEIWANNTLTEVVPPTDLSILNHHAYHVREIKEKADNVGVPIVAYYGKSPILYEAPSKESWTSFCIRKLNQ